MKRKPFGEEIDTNLFMFKVDDLWIRAKRWAKRRNKKPGEDTLPL